MIAVIDYSNASDPLAAMKAAASARRARLYAPRPEPVAPVEIVPPPAKRPAKPKRDYIRDWLALASPESIKPAGYAQIINLVCKRFGVTRLDIISERRTARVVVPRQICCYLMRHCTTLSLPEVGRRLGGRDHTTALSSVRKIERLLAEGHAEIQQAVDELTAELQNTAEGGE